jgi:hypothetical protein
MVITQALHLNHGYLKGQDVIFVITKKIKKHKLLALGVISQCASLTAQLNAKTATKKYGILEAPLRMGCDFFLNFFFNFIF